MFTIPAEWWSGTDTTQTERSRAMRRHTVRTHARDTYRDAIRARRAWHVDRYVALVGVAYPRMDAVMPARAAETVKPIIDAGTDMGLWDDDDATRRCSTMYFQMPEPAPARTYRLTLFILPVPRSYQPAGMLASSLRDRWDGVAGRPDGWGGFTLRLTIPHRCWMSSNLTDTDMAGRLGGSRRAGRWGDGRSFGVRGHVAAQLGMLARQQWERQGGVSLGGVRHIVAAGVSYPAGVGRDQADPDNCAESVNAALDATTGTTGCRLTAFYRVPVDATAGTHGMWLTLLPLPDGAQPVDVVLDGVAAAWADGEVAGR